MGSHTLINKRRFQQCRELSLVSWSFFAETNNILNHLTQSQGSKFKKIPSCLLATIKEKKVAKCKNAVAR